MNIVSISEIITTTKIFNISVITTAAAAATTAESVFNNIISKYLRQLPAQCDIM